MIRKRWITQRRGPRNRCGDGPRFGSDQKRSFASEEDDANQEKHHQKVRKEKEKQKEKKEGTCSSTAHWWKGSKTVSAEAQENLS